MMQMNNPMLQIVSALRNGANPQAILFQMAQNTPQARQVLQMTRGKNQRQIEQMVRNMARERGTTPEAIIQQLGLRR